MDNKETDPTRCKQWFRPTNDGLRFPRMRQCNRKPVKDGYCKQHHPDAVAERQKKSEEHFRATSPYYQYQDLLDKYKKLEEKYKELEKKLMRYETRNKSNAGRHSNHE
jgi:hypothetical protein